MALGRKSVALSHYAQPANQEADHDRGKHHSRQHKPTRRTGPPRGCGVSQSGPRHAGRVGPISSVIYGMRGNDLMTPLALDGPPEPKLRRRPSPRSAGGLKNRDWPLSTSDSRRFQGQRRIWASGPPRGLALKTALTAIDRAAGWSRLRDDTRKADAVTICRKFSEM
jgi:hypothetical protein